MKIHLSILLLIGLHAFASPECDWAITVNEKDPINIGNTNQRIAFIQTLIDKEKQQTLQKELYPQLANWDHALSIYDAHSQAAGQAQLAVNEAINYLKESIITNRAAKLTFDRISQKNKLTNDQKLSDQIRQAIPKMKINDSTRSVLEQWASAVALVEERQIIILDPSKKESLTDQLVENLREINDRLESELEQIKNSRAQDQITKGRIESGIADVQKKISEYLDQISTLQKQIEAWQAQIRQWPVDRFCHTERPSHFLR